MITDQNIIFLLLIGYCSCTWILLTNGSQSQPAHTFAIDYSRDDQVRGVVRWDDPYSDLDLYVYEDYTPLFDQQYAIFQSKEDISNGPVQNFRFSYIPISSYKIIFRVHPMSVTNTAVSYSIQINITNSRYHTRSSIMYYGTIYQNYPFMSFTNINNSKANEGVTIKYQIQGVSDINLLVPGFNGNILPDQQIYIPAQQSPWKVVFNHPTDSITTVSSYNYQIYYKSASDGQQESSSISQVIKIAVSVAGSVVFVMLVVGISWFVYRRMKQQKMKYEEGSKEQLGIDTGVMQSCPICLDGNLDAVLPCRHRFHEKCIKEWQLRNKQCPLCRKQFKGSHIKASILAG